jgi:hypothetical protein
MAQIWRQPPGQAEAAVALIMALVAPEALADCMAAARALVEDTRVLAALAHKA